MVIALDEVGAFVGAMLGAVVGVVVGAVEGMMVGAVDGPVVGVVVAVAGGEYEIGGPSFTEESGD